MGFIALLATACSIGEIDIPRTNAFIVIHGVLNTTSADQVVLVERSLNGAKTIRNTGFNPADPIATDGGIPVSGATVELTTPAGVVVPGTEDRLILAGGAGAGVYRFRLPGSSLLLGQEYRLHVRTLEGEVVSAATTIPESRPVLPVVFTSFNRGRDTLVLRWAAVPKARSYALRIESPFGPFFLFTDSLHYRLTGELRNLFADELPRVFVPGFEQPLLVAAVDSNFYDYYRTQNDPFTGSGIISRVRGGIGLFGALAPVATRLLSVTIDRQQAIEGRYVYATAVSTATPVYATEINLYVESPSPRSDVPAVLSGNYTAPPSRTPRSDGILGAQVGNTVALALLFNQSVFDTVNVFTGQLRGDSLVGSYKSRPGTAVFVKAR
jgi:hypothetical protein